MLQSGSSQHSEERKVLLSSLAQRRLSRRSVLIGLAGLAGTALVGSAIGNLFASPHPFVYRGHTSIVWAVAWFPDGQRIISGSEDGTLQSWDAFSGGHAMTFPRLPQVFGDSNSMPSITALALSPDGRYVVSSQGGKAVVQDTASGKLAFVCQTASYVSNLGPSVAWSPNGNFIAVGEKPDKNFKIRVEVFDAHDGTRVAVYDKHKEDVYAVAWSPDSSHIASGSGDETVQIWDATTGAQTLVYHHIAIPDPYSPGLQKYVAPFAVAWSKQGHIASAYFGDGDWIEVWDAATGERLLMYKKQVGSSISLAWSPDGTRIVSGGAAPEVWDAITGELIYVYGGHTIPDTIGTAIGVSWSPDGNYIATTGTRDTVQVWPAP